MKFRRRTTVMGASALLVLALSACGGSDGPEPTQSNTVSKNLTLFGDQEVPAVVSGGIGKGSFTLDTRQRQLSGSLTLDGITPSTVNLHTGTLGTQGSAVVSLVQGSAGTWSVPSNTVLTPDQASAFQANGMYAEVQTAAYPNGEIRGQIGQELFYAALNAAQAVPASSSSATGTGGVVLDPTTKSITARFQTTGSSATQAHLHIGAVGVAAPAVFSLTASAPGSSAWVLSAATPLTDAQLDSLRAGNFYVDLHSNAGTPNPEIRGQIGRKVRIATLSGTQAFPAVNTSASGDVRLVLDPSTRALTGNITTSGLSGTAAHLHQAPARANGPVVLSFSTGSQSASTSYWNVPANTVLDANVYKSLLRGGLYADVHSAAHPNGEIRGQLAP